MLTLTFVQKKHLKNMQEGNMTGGGNGDDDFAVPWY